MKVLRRRFLAFIILPLYVALAMSGATTAGSCCCHEPTAQPSHGCLIYISDHCDHLSLSTLNDRCGDRVLHEGIHRHSGALGISLSCRHECNCSILPVALPAYIPSAGANVVTETDGVAHRLPATHSLLPLFKLRGGSSTSKVLSFLSISSNCLSTIVLIV